ncbi:MAG: fumarylacetoacetate hydrolase family protein [Candidatus Thiodiazotropha sp.]
MSITGPGQSGDFLPLKDVRTLIPTKPAKLIGLWNNFHSRAELEGWAKPTHPLYFMKANGSFLPNGGQIQQPGSYSGPVVFEGELGIVIGRECCQNRLSHDMTLHPGDVIACGTSLGAGPMNPGGTVEVRIDGIGSLINPFH